jgi:outer membrane protein
MIRIRRLIGALAGAALFVALGGTASQAQQAGGLVIEVPEVRNYAALAVGAVPDYMGSKDYTVGVAPAGMVKFAGDRYVRLVATYVSINLLDNKTWSVGPALNYRLGRSDVKNSSVDKMSTIDGTVEAGAFVGWQSVNPKDPRTRISVSADWLYDVGGEYSGYVGSLSARYFHPVSRAVTLSAGAGIDYGNSDYMDEYFGVSPANSARSGLAVYDAKGGIRDVQFPLMAIFSFSPNWHVAGGAVITQLVGDAADSPLVDDVGSATQVYAGIGVAYAW